jgi:hypothetical protein
MNVQIVQDLSRTVEERLSSRKANISTQSNASVPQVNVPDAQDKMVDNPKVLKAEDLTKVVYPPFFPIGKTQDIDSIKGVKQLTGENVKSASFVTVEEQKAILQKEINSKSTNVDAGAVRHDNAKSTDALMKATTPSVKDEANPGDVLDLKV